MSPLSTHTHKNCSETNPVEDSYLPKIVFDISISIFFSSYESYAGSRKIQSQARGH